MAREPGSLGRTRGACGLERTRSATARSAEPDPRLGPLRLELARRRAWLGADELRLTAREMALLPYTNRITTQRGGKSDRGRDRDDRSPRDRPPRDDDTSVLEVEEFVLESSDVEPAVEVEVVEVLEVAGDGGEPEGEA